MTPLSANLTALAVPVLQVENLRTEFRTATETVVAVDDMSFTLHRGRVFGLVGESGSGKSTAGYSIIDLVSPPGVVSGGRILLHGQDIRRLDPRDMRDIRGNRIAFIPQDPMSWLHPMLTVGAQLIDAIRAHRHVGRKQAWTEARDVLGRVGIPSPSERMAAFPHQLSGGMRQRVAVAVSVLNRPDVIIADEPTTGLDVTVQAQILYEMRKLVTEMGTALIWITHDLAVISNLADTVAVMYAGAIVEQGPVDDVLDRPAHPYTQGLLACAPSRNRGARRLPQIPGSIASAKDETGCPFRPRCAFSQDICRHPVTARQIAVDHEARCVLIDAPGKGAGDG